MILNYAFEANSSLRGTFEKLPAQLQEVNFAVLFFLVAKMPELAKREPISVNRNRKHERLIVVETLPFLYLLFLQKLHIFVLK